MIPINLSQQTLIRLLTDAIKQRWNYTVNTREHVANAIQHASAQIDYARAAIEECDDEEIILQNEEDMSISQEFIRDLSLLGQFMDNLLEPTENDMAHVECLINQNWV